MKKFEQWTKQEKASAVLNGGDDRNKLVNAYYGFVYRYTKDLFYEIEAMLNEADAYVIFAECDTIEEMVQEALKIIKGE